MAPQEIYHGFNPWPQSLVIKVEIQTMDTAEVKTGPALVDSGSTSSLMSQSYVEHNRLNTWKLAWPVPVHNVDGSLNEDGSITQIVDVILCVDGHSERTTFAVVNLSKLVIHYPQIHLACGAQPRDQMADS